MLVFFCFCFLSRWKIEILWPRKYLHVWPWWICGTCSPGLHYPPQTYMRPDVIDIQTCHFPVPKRRPIRSLDCLACISRYSRAYVVYAFRAVISIQPYERTSYTPLGLYWYYSPKSVCGFRPTHSNAGAGRWPPRHRHRRPAYPKEQPRWRCRLTGFPNLLFLSLLHGLVLWTVYDQNTTMRKVENPI